MSGARAATELSGLEATVMGLGLFGGGVAATRWLVGRGARVTVTDLRDGEELSSALEELQGLDLRLVLGEHRREDFEGADWVVVNPAVPRSSPWLQLAASGGARLTSEMEIFLERCRARLVLITGTQGKSSTASMLAQLLEAAGERVRLGGNIGAPLLEQVHQIAPDETCVVEISSYQLEALPEIAPPGRAAAVLVTNVLCDHLERHGTPEAYAQAKARILELLCEDGAALLPHGLCSDPRFTLSRGRRRVSHGGPEAWLRLEDDRFMAGQTDLGAQGDLLLTGSFQRENACLALGAALLLGAPPERLAGAVGDLRGLPHRLEELGSRDGRRILDNGVSTTPESTLAALESVAEPCTLILGGQAKCGLDMGALVSAAALRAVRVVTFGHSGPQLEALMSTAGVASECCASLEHAVERGLNLTPAGGTLLFSPACASFDAYPNFRARALAFRRAVGSLP